jgi:hypothetical protein
MKTKKNNKQKKQNMPEFHFKEFTLEESKVYEEAVFKYREAITAGKTLRQAYESFKISDKELEAVIQADFLKIMIAERHFSQHQSLEDVAASLSISLTLIKDAYARMLQEVGVTASTQFAQEFGSLEPKTSD